MPYPYWPLGRLKLVLGAAPPAPSAPIDIAPSAAPPPPLHEALLDPEVPPTDGAKPRAASVSSWSWRQSWAPTLAALAPVLAPADEALLVMLALPPVGLVPLLGTLVLAAIAAAGGALTTTHIEAGQQRRRRSLVSARNRNTNYARDDVPVMMQVITDLH